MSRNVFFASTLLTLAALTSCGKDFDPYPRLVGLRILALQSQPVAPLPGETSTLTPLVYVPPGKTVTYRWSWCPLPGPSNTGYSCLVTEETLGQIAVAQGATLGAVPPFELGTTETAAFAHGIDPGVLRAICSGALSDGKTTINCDDGFPVQVKLVVRTSDGSDEVTAISTLHLRLDDQGAPNSNPVISAMTVTEPMGNPIAADELGSAEAQRLRKNVVTLVVPASDSEPFRDRDQNDHIIDNVERLYVSWFIESGDVDSERTSYIAGVPEIPLDCATGVSHCLTQNKWKPASEKDFPGAMSRLITVLRDNRGGVSWRTANVKLVVAPP